MTELWSRQAEAFRQIRPDEKEGEASYIEWVTRCKRAYLEQYGNRDYVDLLFYMNACGIFNGERASNNALSKN
jgi:hypothetical protein